MFVVENIENLNLSTIPGSFFISSNTIHMQSVEQWTGVHRPVSALEL